MGLIPRSRRASGRRRRRFSLNGLAIQLSAFALSFTLVALLVVTGSQAAFVEENESVTDPLYVDDVHGVPSHWSVVTGASRSGPLMTAPTVLTMVPVGAPPG